MKLKEIISVSGAGGLFKIITQTKSGIIVESLTDGRRSPVSGTQKVSSLGDIYIFTSGEEMPLRDVFKKFAEAHPDKLPVDGKSEPEALKKFFKTLVADIDEDRVHVSHMKKMVTWYELLRGKIDFNAKEEENDGDNPLLKDEQEKPIAKVHESHAPKAEIHAKTTTARMRKKV